MRRNDQDEGLHSMLLSVAWKRRLRRFPLSAPRWPATGPLEIRVARVRKTPYLLVYMVLSDQLVILAVAHSSKKPGYWASRLQG